jgi:hypothetical protein
MRTMILTALILTSCNSAWAGQLITTNSNGTPARSQKVQAVRTSSGQSGLIQTITQSGSSAVASVLGANGTECDITADVAKLAGTTLGDLVNLLNSENGYVQCTYSQQKRNSAEAEGITFGFVAQ